MHCTPVARELKLAKPHGHLTWLVGKTSAGLLAHNPYIDAVHVWPREIWEEQLRAGRWHKAWQLWQQLRLWLINQHFDVVLDVHGLFITGMIAVMSKAGQRIGMHDTKEYNHLFMTEQAPPVLDRHVIYRYLSVLLPLGISYGRYQPMTLCIPNDADAFLERFFCDNGIKTGDIVIAVNPATTWRTKNWSVDSYAAVAGELAGTYKIILCGGPNDRTIGEELIYKDSSCSVDCV